MSPEILQGEMKKCEMYALLWHARIVSGAYKLRKAYKDNVLMTEEELLSDSLNIMQAHITRYSELLDRLTQLPIERRHS